MYVVYLKCEDGVNTKTPGKPGVLALRILPLLTLKRMLNIKFSERSLMCRNQQNGTLRPQNFLTLL
jgi:hypothetical protein